MLSTAEKFKLLYWKNWKIQFERKKQLVSELILPLLLGCVLIVIRSIAFDDRYFEPKKYEAYEIPCESYIHNNQSEMVYSPSTNIQLNEIMEKVIVNFKDKYDIANFTLVAVNDSKALEEYLIKETAFITVEFEDNLKNAKQLPNDLKYAIRMNEFYSWYWESKYIQRRVFSKKPRSRSSDEGTHYAYDLFLCLQNSIDRSFMEVLDSQKMLPDVKLKRFPEKSFVEDSHYQYLSMIVPLLLMVHYSFVVCNIIREVAKEREFSLKSYQQNLGFSRTLQWSAWFAKALSLNVIGITIWTIFLTQSITLGIFIHSNPFLIWFYLFFFIINLIWFSFFLSMFFSKAKRALITGIIVCVVSLVPYFLMFIGSDYIDEIDSNYIWNLLPASWLGIGSLTISALEVHEGGLNWNTFFLKMQEDGLSMASLFLASILSSLIFIVLIRIIEIIYPDEQKHKKWYYPVQYAWKKIFDKECISSEIRVENKGSDSIQVKNLTKIFKRHKNVIDDVSFKIPKNQITVILGHIGSGKSTIMSILKGEFEPTSGKVEFFENLNPVSIGVCSEKNEMFRKLTVLDQLIFTCRVRGLTTNQALKESRKYLNLLSLVHYRNNMIKTMPLEAIRKVSVINAVCGNVKVVLLDEPTNGLDATTQKQIWDLLREEKKEKTIVLATKCSAEVEVVADKINLLKNGKIQASGSLSQIKEKFGIGYQLVCSKNDNCKPESITRCLKQFVPDIGINKETESSLVYILDESNMPKFPEILEVLENESDNFGISQLKLYRMTLEDILIRKDGKDYGENKSNLEENGEANSAFDPHLFNENSVQGSLIKTGYHLILHQMWIILLKRYYFLRFYYKSNLLLLILTIIVTILFSFISFQRFYEESENLTELKISLANYSKTNVYLQSDRSVEFIEQYRKLIETSQNIVNVSIDDEMDNVILKNGKNYVIGATFLSNNITGWYYNEFYHSAPLSLNLINQAILKTYFGQNYSITVSNKPYLDTSLFSYSYFDDYLSSMDLLWIMIFALIDIILLMCTINVKERTSGMKLLQFNYGFNRLAFWLTSLFLDVFVLILLTCVFLFIILLLDSSLHIIIDLIMATWICLLTFIQAVLLIYLFSTWFRKSLSLKIFFIIFNVLPYFLLEPLVQSELISRDVFKCLMKPIPLFNFVDAIERTHISSLLILPTIFIYIGILMLIEHRFLLLNFLYRNRTAPKFICADDMDIEVVNEIEKVRLLTNHQTSEYGIVFQSVTNSRSKEGTLNLLSLTVNKSSFVAVICQNSKIRSSIFKMITGDERINSGDIFINGNSVKHNSKTALKVLGYCSKDCNLFKHMTGRENLKILGLIKNIPKNILDEKINKLSEVFGFAECLDNLVKGYSEMNRKLLGFGVALLDDPQVIVLEEPINGLDEITTQKILKLLNKLKSNGKTILILSNNLLPYESICNKITIIVEGEMKFVDPPENFRNKYSKGLKITVELNEQESDDKKLQKITEIKNFVQGSFIDSKLRSEDSKKLTFNITLNHKKLSEAFKILEELKTFNITKYSVTENSLDNFMNSLSYKGI